MGRYSARGRFVVYNMHGPTVYQSNDLATVERDAIRASENAGYYRIVDSHDNDQTVREYRDGIEIRREPVKETI